MTATDAATRTPALRRLTRDVRNPNFDRRCRYGDKSVAVFEAGFVFLYQSLVDGHSAKTQHLGYIYSVKVVEELYRASESYTPTTWAECCLERGFENAEFFALDALNLLVADGSISIEKARALVAAVLDADQGFPQ